MSVKKICPDGLDGLDVLCNNVDVMCLENSATKDGYSLEVQGERSGWSKATAETTYRLPT